MIQKVYQWEFISIFVGLPDIYVRKIFVELALFHATSYHFIQNNPGLVNKCYSREPLKSGFFATLRRNHYFEKRHMNNLTIASKALINKGCKALGDKLQAFKEKVEKHGSKEEPKGTFQVILHGDAWSNNFMIR